MPANPDRKQITTWLTPSQVAVLKQTIGDGNQSQFIREAIAEKIAKQGIDWPDDLPRRGKYERKDDG